MKKKPKERRASFSLHDEQGRILGYASLHIEGFDVPEPMWKAVMRLIERARVEAMLAGTEAVAKADKAKARRQPGA